MSPEAMTLVELLEDVASEFDGPYASYGTELAARAERLKKALEGFARHRHENEATYGSVLEALSAINAPSKPGAGR